MWPELPQQVYFQVGFLLLSFAFMSGQRILSVVCNEKVKSALAGWISSNKIPLSIGNGNFSWDLKSVARKAYHGFSGARGGTQRPEHIAPCTIPALASGALGPDHCPSQGLHRTGHAGQGPVENFSSPSVHVCSSRLCFCFYMKFCLNPKRCDFSSGLCHSCRQLQYFLTK